MEEYMTPKSSVFNGQKTPWCSLGQLQSRPAPKHIITWSMLVVDSTDAFVNASLSRLAHENMEAARFFLGFEPHCMIKMGGHP
jgi:hypothetical protein